MDVPRLEQVADFGSGEPFVARITIGIYELLDALEANETNKRSQIDALGEVSEELDYAFIALRKIQNKKRPLLVAERKKEYSNLYDHLWTAYKDRFQKLIDLIGFDIGFLFKNDRDFEKESTEYFHANKLPEKLRQMMKHDRKIWQNALGDFRNHYRQHRHISHEIEKVWFNQDLAQKTFDNVWQAIEDVTVWLLQTKLEKSTKSLRIVEIPEATRDPACPRRFTVDLTPEAFKSLKESGSESQR